jgi:hypothetical protein
MEMKGPHKPRARKTSEAVKVYNERARPPSRALPLQFWPTQPSARTRSAG